MPNHPYIDTSIMWIVGITNAVNPRLRTRRRIFHIIARFSSLRYSELDLSRQQRRLLAALSGSTLGFLPFNFNPAKIYLGETGAAFLGFILGVISIQGVMKSYAAISIAIPLLVLGLPLFDTTFAIVRRLFSHKSIMQGDRGHLHHRLIDMGTEPETVCPDTVYGQRDPGPLRHRARRQGHFERGRHVAGSGNIRHRRRQIYERPGTDRRILIQPMTPVPRRQCQRTTLKNLRWSSKMKRLKIMPIFGTRPDAVKMAPW